MESYEEIELEENAANMHVHEVPETEANEETLLSESGETTQSNITAETTTKQEKKSLHTKATVSTSIIFLLVVSLACSVVAVSLATVLFLHVRYLEEQLASAQNSILNTAHSTRKMKTDILNLTNQAHIFTKNLSDANHLHKELTSEVVNLKADTKLANQGLGSSLLVAHSQCYQILPS